jgi:hypothetical protein
MDGLECVFYRELKYSFGVMHNSEDEICYIKTGKSVVTNLIIM